MIEKKFSALINNQEESKKQTIIDKKQHIKMRFLVLRLCKENHNQKSENENKNIYIQSKANNINNINNTYNTYNTYNIYNIYNINDINNIKNIDLVSHFSNECIESQCTPHTMLSNIPLYAVCVSLL